MIVNVMTAVNRSRLNFSSRIPSSATNHVFIYVLGSFFIYYFIQPFLFLFYNFIIICFLFIYLDLFMLCLSNFFQLIISAELFFQHWKVFLTAVH